MAIKLQKGEKDIGRVVDSLNEVIEGRMNSVGDVTLTAGATSTVVSFPNCSKDSRVFLEPQTANAAAALATTYVPKATIVQKQFTIQHANNAQTDRTFSYLCIGG